MLNPNMNTCGLNPGFSTWHRTSLSSGEAFSLALCFTFHVAIFNHLFKPPVSGVSGGVMTQLAYVLSVGIGAGRQQVGRRMWQTEAGQTDLEENLLLSFILEQNCRGVAALCGFTGTGWAVAKELPKVLSWIGVRTLVKHFMMSCTGQRIWRNSPPVLAKAREQEAAGVFNVNLHFISVMDFIGQADLFAELKITSNVTLFLLIWEHKS